eukprot:gene1285-1403_t
MMHWTILSSWIIFFLPFANSFFFSSNRPIISNVIAPTLLLPIQPHSIVRSSDGQWKRKAQSKDFLLPTPPANSIGNFFENTSERATFIQCYMISIGSLNGTQYGVGFPVDMPVMLTYFEDGELKPVRPDHPKYDHLLDHVTMQLDDNDLQLYRTPVVLTLQGEFEDEKFNQLYLGDDSDDEEEEEEEEEEEDWEPPTLQDLLDREKYFDEQDDEEDSYDEEEDEGDDDGDVASDEDNDDYSDEEGENAESDRDFWNSSPAGKIDEKYANLEDFQLYSPTEADLSDVPSDAIVTEEDTRSLHRAHRKADRILTYAEDVKLMATFHYCKKNYHLVRLLEPIFVIGRRLNDIKGFYFSLLDEQESEQIRPALEDLIVKDIQERKPERLSTTNSGEGRRARRSRRVERGDNSENAVNNHKGYLDNREEESPKTTNNAPRRLRRGWLNRKQKSNE